MTKNICLLTHTSITEDPRVQRHASALMGAGYKVTVVGTYNRDRTSLPPYCLAAPKLVFTKRQKLEFALRLAPARLIPDASVWLMNRLPTLRALKNLLQKTEFDLVIVNDWLTLGLAQQVASKRGVKYAYDSHEYGVEELAHKSLWKILFPPHIRNLENKCLRDAAFVMTVSEGIATLLQRDYDLADKPTVIRNIPDGLPSGPTQSISEMITVLFHGTLSDDRGLSELIKSTRDWVDERRLIIRGRAEPYQQRALQESIQAAVGRDIVLEPPVPMSEVVTTAAKADIGVHPMPPLTNQTRYALPNKFFEYLHAGLAIVVVGPSEMADMVAQHDLGAVSENGSPEALANAINSLTPERIQYCKSNARKLANELTWENEAKRLIELVEATSN